MPLFYSSPCTQFVFLSLKGQCHEIYALSLSLTFVDVGGDDDDEEDQNENVDQGDILQVVVISYAVAPTTTTLMLLLFVICRQHVALCQSAARGATSRIALQAILHCVVVVVISVVIAFVVVVAVVLVDVVVNRVHVHWQLVGVPVRFHLWQERRGRGS